eukprot:276424-Prymnesium_polylepis.1
MVRWRRQQARARGGGVRPPQSRIGIHCIQLCQNIVGYTAAGGAVRCPLWPRSCVAVPCAGCA